MRARRSQSNWICSAVKRRRWRVDIILFCALNKCGAVTERWWSNIYDQTQDDRFLPTQSEKRRPISASTTGLSMSMNSYIQAWKKLWFQVFHPLTPGAEGEKKKSSSARFLGKRKALTWDTDSFFLISSFMNHRLEWGSALISRQGMSAHVLCALLPPCGRKRYSFRQLWLIVDILKPKGPD